MNASSNHFAFSNSPTELNAYFSALQRERARPFVPIVIACAMTLSLIGLLHDTLLFSPLSEQGLSLRLIQIAMLACLLGLQFFISPRYFQLETFILWSVIIFALPSSVLYTLIMDHPLLLTLNLALYLCAVVLIQLTPKLAIQAGVFMVIIFLGCQLMIRESFDLWFSASMFLVIWTAAAITASKILENHNRRLFMFERQLYEINRVAVKAQEDESKANQEKSRFLANMSHEIRTPLTAIMGFAESIKHDSKSYQEIQEAVDIIYRNGEYLLSLIKDILDISKVEAGKLNIESKSFSLFDWLHQIIDAVDRLAETKQVHFDCDFNFPLPEQINGDPLRLQQVLMNVLGNAIKFASAGKVSLKVSASDNLKIIVFTITDNGIGMDDKTLRNLFRPFVQGDSSTTRRYGGTGLGLYISYQLMQRMGGDIRVQSTPNKGSEFTVILPMILPASCIWLDEEPLRRINQEHPFNQQQLSGRVLLAEDQPDNRELIKHLLQQLGVDITTASNGEEAVSHALQEDYHLILMDMQMPVLDGLAATKLIRDAGCKAPIVALTANVMTADIERYKNAGCVEVLAKPIQRERFTEIIHSFLEPQQESVAKQNQSAQAFSTGEQFNNLKQNYYETLKQELHQLRESFSQEQIQTLKKVAHRIKGSAGNFNLSNVSEAAADIEQAITNLERCFYYSMESIEQNIQRQSHNEQVGNRSELS